MFYPHHPHLFSREWLILHPKWVARFNRYGLPLGLGAVLAGTTLLIGKADSTPNMPLKGAELATLVVDEPFVPTGMTGYLPPQLYEQEKQASNRKPPAQ
jgi:hypothetical protein